jgi:glycerol-3-phosphate acyltransferase PlsX
LKVIVDAMGGDNAPGAIVAGCVLGLEANKKLNVTLVGKSDEIAAELEKYEYDESRMSVVNAMETIEMAEPPVDAIRKKKDSSMVVAFKLLKENPQSVFITAGSTGATVAGSTLIVRRIKGVKRPALAALVPTKKEKMLVLDVGANSDCRPSFLAQFALMGSIYMQKVEGVVNPRVGLVSNGSEDEKGNELTKAAFKLIKKMPVDFKGNTEARELMSGDYDVMVADGFTGNVIIKFLEGLAGALMFMLKSELKKTLRTKIGAALAMPAFKGFKNSMDYKEYGGALLLGINGGVLKAHGSSDATAIKSTLRQAADFIEGDVVNVIRNEILKIKIED